MGDLKWIPWDTNFHADEKVIPLLAKYGAEATHHLLMCACLIAKNKHAALAKEHLAYLIPNCNEEVLNAVLSSGVFYTDDDGKYRSHKIDSQCEKTDRRRENGKRGGRPKKAIAKPIENQKDNQMVSGAEFSDKKCAQKPKGYPNGKPNENQEGNHTSLISSGFISDKQSGDKLPLSRTRDLRGVPPQENAFTRFKEIWESFHASVSTMPMFWDDDSEEWLRKMLRKSRGFIEAQNKALQLKGLPTYELSPDLLVEFFENLGKGVLALKNDFYRDPSKGFSLRSWTNNFQKLAEQVNANSEITRKQKRAAAIAETNGPYTRRSKRRSQGLSGAG